MRIYPEPWGSWLSSYLLQTTLSATPPQMPARCQTPLLQMRATGDVLRMLDSVLPVTLVNKHSRDVYQQAETVSSAYLEPYLYMCMCMFSLPLVAQIEISHYSNPETEKNGGRHFLGLGHTLARGVIRVAQALLETTW